MLGDSEGIGWRKKCRCSNIRSGQPRWKFHVGFGMEKNFGSTAGGTKSGSGEKRI